MPNKSNPERPVSGVYAIRNIVTDRCYVGSSINMEGRWKQHQAMLRKGEHHSKYLQAAWNAYGAGAFRLEVLEHVEVERLLEVENRWIRDLQAAAAQGGYNAASQAHRGAGAQPKENPAWRPQLRLPTSALERLKQMSLEDVAAMLEWALPRWPGRIDPATIHPSRKTVVLRPQKPRHLIPMRLWVEEDAGKLFVQRHDPSKDLFRVMVELGFSFNENSRQFERKLSRRTGAPADRLAEAAAQLYAAGWPVEVPSEELAEKVVKGQYLRGQERWLDVLTDGNFLLRWEYGGDDVYQALSNVHSARWNKALGGTVVSRHAFDELEDFALSWGFAITEDAQKALIQARKDAARELIGVDIVIPEKPRPQPAHTPTATEEVSIPDDLLADHD